MTSGRGVRYAAGVLGMAGLLLAGTVPGSPLRGQEEEEPAPADTAAVPDTVPRDTFPADTLPADTVPGARPDSARLKQVQEGLAGGGFPERDSIFRQLMEQEGFRALEYRGREVELEVPERRIRLRDSAQVNYGDAALQADTILYRSRLQFIDARRGIRLVSPEQREMTTDSVLYYDVSRLKGTVLGAHTSFAARGAQWQVEGDAIPLGSRTLYVNRGTFTSCNRPNPHYHFKAGKIKMVSEDVIVAWPVTFYISDVPVFWLPFFAQDIRPERRSGIVVPEFGINDLVTFEDDRSRRGTGRNISGFGYFWAINRFMDAKFTVDWFSGNFTRLNADYRYNFRKKFMNGTVNLSREWGDRGRNFSVNARHQQEFSPDTRLTANLRFVQSQQLLQDRSFETEEQTQDIRSEVGLSHEFDFGSLEVSGRRQQFLGEEDRTDLTLPNLRLSLSPVNLFEAPRTRAGLFNNVTLSPGALNFSRDQRTRDIGDDVVRTRASVGPTIRFGDLSLSTRSNFRQTETTPFRTVVDDATGDTLFSGDLREQLESTVDWSASTGYQIDLFGSTTLSPNVSLSKEWFRSDVPVDSVTGDTVPDTDGRFVAAPTRINSGARLSTDLFAFFPGIGPFSRIRHKFSPRFSWNFSPGVSPDSLLREVRGARETETRNTLQVNFSQTFEAKIPAGRARRDEERAREDREEAAADTALQGPAAARDTAGAPRDTAAAGAAGAGDADGAGTQQQRRGPRRERKVTLLAVRSSGLQFDFNNPGPALVTDRFSNDISSDLFPEGFRIRVEHDLFEGSGADRNFEPFLSGLTASMRLSSRTDFSELVGLGRGGRGGGGGRRRSGRDREHRGGAHEAGPWDLSLDYDLQRSREDEGGATRQTLGGNLRLFPTPNWEMRWRTSFDFEDSKFQSQNVELTRTLHRWEAVFRFTRAPNGNFVFAFSVRLKDAEQVRFDFDQRSETF